MDVRFQRPRFSSHLLTVLLILGISTGCQLSSRWALDDPVYAEKYDRPYRGSDAERYGRMLKQSVDARHVTGRGGTQIGLSAADEPTSAGGYLGVTHFPAGWMETRAGLQGLAGTGADDWFLGGDLGLRVHAPSRLAPFAGVGSYIGGNREMVNARGDLQDNDHDGAIDELGEEKARYKFLASFYPEVGLHYWITGDTRLTAGAQYHLTTEGRDADFWFVGLSLTFLGGPDDCGEPADEVWVSEGELKDLSEPAVPLPEDLEQLVGP